MKKNGFTLAEVLLALGIVGVVAAITMPTLVSNSRTAQIGPKLAKAVSMFEQANQAMLSDKNVDNVTSSLTDFNGVNYGNALTDYLKISKAYPADGNSQTFCSKDGVCYKFRDLGKFGAYSETKPHKQRIGTVWILINGINSESKDGVNTFYFSLWNDGSLRPKGSTNWLGGYSCKDYDEDGDGNKVCKEFKQDVQDHPGGDEHWKTKCPADAKPSSPSYCAGHIFENNLKVLYQ